MQPTIGPIGLVLLTISHVLVSACSSMGSSPALSTHQTTQEPFPTTFVQVMQPVHFQAPDGADVLTPAGAYRVELAGDEQLRLISNQPDTQPLIIVAVHVESRTEQYLPSAE